MNRRDPLADPAPLIRQVYSFVAFHLRSRADAEDVTSEVFERAVRYRASFDPAKASPATWLLGIARRCIADAALRGQGGTEQLEDAADSVDVEESTLRRLELSDALALLPDRDRELLALRYGSELTTKQIAGMVDLAPGAVDVALHRARERLRAVLDPPTGHPLDRPKGRDFAEGQPIQDEGPDFRHS